MNDPDSLSNDSHKPHQIPIAGSDVPSYACVVYISEQSGKVSARVANLVKSDESPIVSSGASEREVLADIVKQFKGIVANEIDAGNEPKWLEPAKEKEANEQKRFLPVHL